MFEHPAYVVVHPLAGGSVTVYVPAGKVSSLLPSASKACVPPPPETENENALGETEPPTTTFFTWSLGFGGGAGGAGAGAGGAGAGAGGAGAGAGAGAGVGAGPEPSADGMAASLELRGATTALELFGAFVASEPKRTGESSYASWGVRPNRVAAISTSAREELPELT